MESKDTPGTRDVDAQGAFERDVDDQGAFERDLDTESAMNEAEANRQKRALLIGINTYPNLAELDEAGNVKKERNLFGCVNDVTVMRTVLEEQFKFPPENITLLTEEAATRDGILQAMNTLTEQVQKDDIVVMVYAGHGSRRPDPEGDEPDGYDSTLVPYDSGRAFRYNSAPNRDITDDEIYLWINHKRVTPEFIAVLVRPHFL